MDYYTTLHSLEEQWEKIKERYQDIWQINVQWHLD